MTSSEVNSTMFVVMELDGDVPVAIALTKERVAKNRWREDVK